MFCSMYIVQCNDNWHLLFSCMKLGFKKFNYVFHNTYEKNSTLTMYTSNLRYKEYICVQCNMDIIMSGTYITASKITHKNQERKSQIQKTQYKNKQAIILIPSRQNL